MDPCEAKANPRFEIVNSKDTLFTKFERIWESIEPSYVLSLIDGIIKRIEVVIKARGGHTRY
jgi:hypothetical protein